MSDVYLSTERVEVPGPTESSSQVKYNVGDPIDPNDFETLVAQGHLTKKEAKDAAKDAASE